MSFSGTKYLFCTQLCFSMSDCITHVVLPSNITAIAEYGKCRLLEGKGSLWFNFAFTYGAHIVVSVQQEKGEENDETPREIWDWVPLWSKLKVPPEKMYLTSWLSLWSGSWLCLSHLVVRRTVRVQDHVQNYKVRVTFCPLSIFNSI